MAHQPDGMGADRYRERQNMAEARHAPEPSHDVVAVDENGEELYVAESAWTESAAESERDACISLHEECDPEKFDGVDTFEVRER